MQHLKVILLCLFISLASTARAQVILSESFEGVPLPLANNVGSNVLPFGWGLNQDFSFNINFWDRVTSSTLPQCSARTGNGMLRFRSGNPATWNNNAVVSSRVLDYRGWTSGTVTVSFYMYRDSYVSNDSLEIYLSTVPYTTPGSIKLTEKNSGATSIHRCCTLSPATALCSWSLTTYSPTAWSKYEFDLPIASIASIDRDSLFILLKGYATNNGKNIYIDDFQVNFYPLSPVLQAALLSSQNANYTAIGKTNQQIITGYIETSGESSELTANNFLFNTNGSTNPPTDILNAKLYYTGGTVPVESDTLGMKLIQTFPNPWNTNYLFNSAINLLHGRNYFCVAYDISPSAVYNNHVDAQWISFDLIRTKQGVTGSLGSSSITVTDTAGIIPGMQVVGSGISGGAIVASFTGSNIVNLNFANTGVVNGAVQFIQTVTPSVQTINGDRIILTQLYTTPISSCKPFGQLFCDGANPEYIAGVRLDGNAAPAGGIYTGYQPEFPVASRVATGTYNTYNGIDQWWSNALDQGAPIGDSCICAPSYALLYNVYPNGHCPFSDRDDSYEYFPPHAGTSTLVKTDGETNHQLQVWYGSTLYHKYGYSFSVHVGAWIDLNNDGVLNDNLLITTYTGVPGSAGASQIIPTGDLTSGSSIVTLTMPWTGWAPAFAVGRPIWGPGIPSGTSIVAWNPGTSTITLSQNATATLSASNIYTGFNGGEKIGHSDKFGAPASCLFNFCLPANTYQGVKRLRVRLLWGGYSMHPDQPRLTGETEDYDLVAASGCDASAYGGPPAYNKIWLGYTDEWTNPANWCGGIPTVYDNVFIPKSGVGGRPGVFSPKIKNGVTATCGRLRIQQSDSLILDAFSTGDFVIADSLIIESGAMLKVVSAKIDTARVNNGTTNYPTFYAPFRDGAKVRALIVLRPDDLVAQGMEYGDYVDSLFFHVQRLSTPFVTDFTNVTIRLSRVAPNVTFLPGLLGAIPLYTLAPTVIFSGTITATGTPAGAYTTLKIPLIPGSFQVLSSPDFYMLEICYENNGAAGGGTFNFKGTYLPGINFYGVVYGNPGVAACSMQPNDALNPATWYVSQYRPNITFKFNRPYTRYFIESRRHWVNDGAFDAGYSLVSMTGATAAGIPNIYTQKISGINSSNFYDLKIDNTSHVTRKTDFTVVDSLILENGWLKLDSGTVTLANPDSGALYRINGNLSSETAPASGLYYGNFRWLMSGSTPQTYTIPFINNAGVQVPVTYKTLVGDHDVMFATFATPPDNTPLPEESVAYPAPVIANVNSFNTGVSNSMNMVDRYWKIYNNTPSGAEADITLSYAASEAAATGNANMISQRWVTNANSFTPGPGWELPFLTGQVFNPNSVLIPGFSNFADNIWWAIVKEETPLPVSLLQFTAQPVKDKVRLNWTTGAEFNNEKFVVERTVNLNEYVFIDEVKSKGNSTTTQNYETWDEFPVNGKQYYMLRQHDYSGKVTSFGPVAVDLTKKAFGIVNVSPHPASGTITLIFNYDSEVPYSVTLTDVMGKVVAASSDNPGLPGLNVLEIQTTLASGVYQVVLQNRSQRDIIKLFY